jgi:hypothetical protein
VGLEIDDGKFLMQLVHSLKRKFTAGLNCISGSNRRVDNVELGLTRRAGKRTLQNPISDPAPLRLTKSSHAKRINPKRYRCLISFPARRGQRVRATSLPGSTEHNVIADSDVRLTGRRF